MYAAIVLLTTALGKEWRRWLYNSNNFSIICYLHLKAKRTNFIYTDTDGNKEDIWTFCVQKKWRKKDVRLMRTYEIANDILRISPAEFMTFTQIEEQRDSDWFSDLNSEELKMLLDRKKDK